MWRTRVLGLQDFAGFSDDLGGTYYLVLRVPFLGLRVPFLGLRVFFSVFGRLLLSCDASTCFILGGCLYYVWAMLYLCIDDYGNSGSAVYCGRVLYRWHCFASVANGCSSINDIVFVVLTVVQVAGEDSRDKRPLWGALSRETTSWATQRVLLCPYGFSGSFGGVVSLTKPSGWTIQ